MFAVDAESSMKREIRCRRFLPSPPGEKDKNRKRERKKTNRFLLRARVLNEREAGERIIRSHFDETNFRSTVTSDTTLPTKAFALAWKTDARRSSLHDRPASRVAYEWSRGAWRRATRLTSPPSSRTQVPATNRARRPTNRALAAYAPTRFTRQRRVNEDPWRRIDTDIWLLIYFMMINGRISPILRTRAYICKLCIFWFIHI